MKVLSKMKIGVKLGVITGSAALAGIVAAALLLSAAMTYQQAEAGQVSDARKAQVTALQASAASKIMAMETLLFLSTQDARHADLKQKADEEAGEKFDAAAELCKVLPNAKAVLDALEEAAELDESQCNPLENKLIGLARAGKAADALASYTRDYVPLREKLEAKIAAAIERIGEGAEATAAAADRTMASAILWAIGTAVVLLVLATFVAVATGRGLVGSTKTLAQALTELETGCLASLSHSLHDLANGDLSSELDAHARRLDVTTQDEVGDMLQTFNGMSHQVENAIGSFNAARAALVKLVGEVAQSSASVAAMSQTLAATSKQSDLAASEIAEGSERLAVRAEAAAAVMDELAVTADHVRSSSSEQRGLVGHAGDALESAVEGIRDMQRSIQSMESIAHDGDAAVRATVDTMGQVRHTVSLAAEQVKNLNDQAQQIGTIVETIQRIAEQTNLLSLNAAIEAARAGEHGRGFAVVADEVRKLSEEASSSTREITTLINGIGDAVAKTVTVMRETTAGVEAGGVRSEEAGAALSRIVEAAKQVALECGSVTDAAQEVSSTMTDVAKSVDQNEVRAADMSGNANSVIESISDVAAVSQQAAAGAQELSASIEEVSSAAAELAEMSHRMQEAVGQFRTSDERSFLKVAA